MATPGGIEKDEELDRPGSEAASEARGEIADYNYVVECEDDPKSKFKI